MACLGMLDTAPAQVAAESDSGQQPNVVPNVERNEHSGGSCSARLQLTTHGPGAHRPGQRDVNGVECRPERVKKKDARPTGKDADVERRGRFRERRAAVAAVVREADGAANSPYWCPEVTLRIADSFRGGKEEI